jgi:hypothetical protein
MILWFSQNLPGSGNKPLIVVLFFPADAVPPYHPFDRRASTARKYISRDPPRAMFIFCIQCSQEECATMARGGGECSCEAVQAGLTGPSAGVKV